MLKYKWLDVSQFWRLFLEIENCLFLFSTLFIIWPHYKITIFVEESDFSLWIETIVAAPVLHKHE